ncbi:hypothetical protein FLACOL7796_04602 [Flavobacterium collinsii]|uniref:Uncharacterized protein n=1 Tax=Flavobacterium collinsii TaxID=1114861 RepID=A0ABN7ER49_9FLAO|nr:hypothetical protein FLACOL7796_04602 [Flavobacterium collinsii]
MTPLVFTKRSVIGKALGTNLAIPPVTLPPAPEIVGTG